MQEREDKEASHGVLRITIQWLAAVLKGTMLLQVPVTCRRNIL
jgi:hypothetical protein